MATYEDLIAAARKADAAGEADDARRLLEMAVALRAAPIPQRNDNGTYGQPPEGMISNPITGQMTERALLGAQSQPTQAGAAASGAMQGLGFGLGDEAMALGGLIEGGPEMAALRREQARGIMEAQQAAYPVTYGASMIGGGAASSLASAGALGLQAAPTLAGRAVQGAGLGSAEGALFGFGMGEGATDRATGAATGGTIGGLVGAAAPYAIHGVRTGFDRVVGGPMASMRSAPSVTRASQAVQAALDRSGMSVDDAQRAIANAQQRGQPFVMADALGNPGQRMLSGIARQPGAGRTEIADFLAGRQAEQGRRIAGALDEGFNTPRNPDNLPVVYGQAAQGDYVGQTAAQVRRGIEAARDKAANVQFEAARQGAKPVDVRPVIAAIDDTIGPMQGSGVGGDGVDRILSGYRNRIAAPEGKLPDGTTAVELSDFSRLARLRKEMGDEAQALAQSGKRYAAGEIRKLMGVLDQQLEAASSGYQQANANFRTASKVADAVDRGTAMTSPRARVADNLQAYGAMTPQEQAAARAGYVDPLIGRIENAAPGVNNARPLLAPGAQAEIGAMARNPKGLQEFLRREQTMFETGAQALGGSRTADNLADIADAQAFDVGPILNALSGRWGAAAQQVAGKAGNALLGRNTATRDEIARLLLSTDPAKALAPALAKQQSVAAQSRVVEALLRSMERNAVEGVR